MITLGQCRRIEITLLSVAGPAGCSSQVRQGRVTLADSETTKWRLGVSI